MEIRKRNIMINKAGGTAGKESVNYRLSLPAPWVEQLGLSKEERGLILSFDGTKIIIEKEMLKLKKLTEVIRELEERGFENIIEDENTLLDLNYYDADEDLEILKIEEKSEREVIVTTEYNEVLIFKKEREYTAKEKEIIDFLVTHLDECTDTEAHELYNKLTDSFIMYDELNDEYIEKIVRQLKVKDEFKELIKD